MGPQQQKTTWSKNRKVRLYWGQTKRNRLDKDNGDVLQGHPVSPETLCTI